MERPMSNTNVNTHFWVDRSDYAQTHIKTTELPQALSDGQVLLKVDRFAFTANNITYAAVGDMIGYWKFFPAEEGLGTIPVWGFADVVDSNCEGVEVGERFYGYYPMSSYLLAEPGKIGKQSFTDVMAHRLELPIIYNQYIRCSSDPSYKQEAEALQMVLRPLFTTSFLLDDFFADENFFGANTVVLTSASSKTALGMAFLLKNNREGREQDYKIVGLTSEHNKAFVEGLGCYDQVLTYDQLSQLDASQPTASVDFAGNGQLLADLHRHLGEQLKYSCLVGVSHWDQRGGMSEDVPGPQPQMFFAPSQAEKRLGDWGAEGFQQRLHTQWVGFTGFVSDWMDIEENAGQAAVESIYQKMLSGDVNPSKGYILSL
ncbi:DUF2855 family protein [Maricurvus nonylphenolicus]